MNLLRSLHPSRSDQKPSAGGPPQGGAVVAQECHHPVTESPACTCERRDHPSGRGGQAQPRRASEQLRLKESGEEAPPGGTDAGTHLS